MCIFSSNFIIMLLYFRCSLDIMLEVFCMLVDNRSLFQISLIYQGISEYVYSPERGHSTYT